MIFFTSLCSLLCVCGVLWTTQLNGYLRFYQKKGEGGASKYGHLKEAKWPPGARPRARPPKSRKGPPGSADEEEGEEKENKTRERGFAATRPGPPQAPLRPASGPARMSGSPWSSRPGSATRGPGSAPPKPAPPRPSPWSSPIGPAT